MTVAVIGIGNPDRGDDALGVQVIARLRGLVGDGVRLASVGGDTLRLFDCWQGAESVHLVDAMQAGTAPGAVRRIDASRDGVASALGAFVSSHAFGLADAIELARNLGRLPRRLVVWGAEAQQFAHGAELSAPVQRAADELARSIAAECGDAPAAG